MAAAVAAAFVAAGVSWQQPRSRYDTRFEDREGPLSLKSREPKQDAPPHSRTERRQSTLPGFMIPFGSSVALIATRT